MEKHFSNAEKRRIEIVRAYLSNQPITQQKICARYGIHRATLGRWLKRYGDEVKRYGVCADKNHSPDDKANEVTIPFGEYYELLHVKALYDAIRTLLQ